jgi:hypothetical protein
MSRLLLTIDQTPCRASYGLLGHEAFRIDLRDRQRQVVQDNIARVVARGDRLAQINPGDGIAVIAAEAYLSEEPAVDIALKFVERPVFSVIEARAIDIVI